MFDILDKFKTLEKVQKKDVAKKLMIVEYMSRNN